MKAFKDRVSVTNQGILLGRERGENKSVYQKSRIEREEADVSAFELAAKCVLPRVRNVEEAVFVPSKKLVRIVEKRPRSNLLVLLIDGAHKSCGGWENFIHENEDGLLRREFDSLSDNIDKLSHGQILCNIRLVYVPKGEYKHPTCARSGARQPKANLELREAEQVQGCTLGAETH